MIKLFIVAVAASATVNPIPQTVYGPACSPVMTDQHLRHLQICAQLEELSGFVRGDVSVKCTNSVNQPYKCDAITGGVIYLYKDGILLSPQSSVNCSGNCGYPQENGYSLNDPNQPLGQRYQVVFTIDRIDTSSGVFYTNLRQDSNVGTI